MTAAQLLRKFFELHNPERVDFVGEILEQYEPAALVEALTKKYGAAPTSLAEIMLRERKAKAAATSAPSTTAAAPAPASATAAAPRASKSVVRMFLQYVVAPIVLAFVLQQAVELTACAPNEPECVHVALAMHRDPSAKEMPPFSALFEFDDQEIPEEYL